MPAIFISYRRDDTSSATGRLTDSLAARFGPDEIFRDIQTIDAGTDFRSALRDALRTAQVVLVVIGRFWLTPRDEARTPRLHHQDDYVRLEIEEALAQEIAVVPILVEGARMPAVNELPDSIRPLAFRQAHEISESRWKYDTDRLADVLATMSGVPLGLAAGSPSAGAAHAARLAVVPAVTQLFGDFLRLLYEPKQLLAAHGSAGPHSVIRAATFLVLSQLLGTALVLQEWPTASSTFDFLITPPIMMALLALAISVPLYLAWRLAGAPRSYQRVLVILLYQVSFVGLCLSVMTVVMLVGIKIAVPGAIEQIAATPTVQAALDVLAAVQATAHPVAWLVASMVSALILATSVVWLAMTWGAYRVVLGLPRTRSAAALVLFGLLFFGPVSLIVWIATLI